jgi:predicted amidohydrolase
LSFTEDRWRAHAYGIPATLAGLDRSGDDNGVREAIFLIWKAIAGAPSPIKHLYSLIRESDILATAETFDMKADDYGLEFEGKEPDQLIVRRLGACLRALEREFCEWDLGSRRSRIDEWRVEHAGESAYFIPMGRMAWREPKHPDRDQRPFDQRGVLRLRIIPMVVDGAQVRLFRPKHMRRSGASNFGAVLFPEYTFTCTQTATTFVVDAVDIPNAPDIIKQACEAAHREECVTAVFPELMIDPQSRDLIQEQLRTKPWLKEGSKPHSPRFVVAGSWHEMSGSSRYNVATVFDGHGVEVLRHRKRFVYKDESSRAEEIQHGNELEILVLSDALFAFGICLDFCHRCFTTPYGELDVDFVVVPSCGNETTMGGHIRTALDLHDARKTRSFVVQEAHPLLADVAGFVLNPDGDPANWVVKNLCRSQPWNVFPCKMLYDN